MLTTTLAHFLGGSSVAGCKLKEKRYSHWVRPNEGATNKTGFTALPSGIRFSNGQFSRLGYFGSWWSSTKYSTEAGYAYNVRYVDNNFPNGNHYGMVGFSVRCLKD